MPVTQHRWNRSPAAFLAGLAGLSLGMALSVARADEAIVAVATNFVEVMRQLETDFEQESGHALTLVSGSSGKLYAQITNGAPFDVYLAADRERPRRLVEAGIAVAGSQRSYATGRLVLWSPTSTGLSDNGVTILRHGDFRKLAIANPALAPYGAAARETLVSLGLYDRLRERLVIAENVGQAFAMVATGNAEFGLIAMSTIVDPRHAGKGSHWVVPQAYHAPIRQDAVLLQRAADNAAALALYGWLQAPDARTIIQRFGYETE